MARQPEVVQSRRRGCQLVTDRCDLEADSLASAWPGRAKGATEIPVLLLELAEALEAFVLMKRAQAGGPPASATILRTYNRLAEYIGKPPGGERRSTT